MSYGVTKTGIVIPNFDEEKATFEASVQSKLGAVDFDAPSVFSVLSSVHSTMMMRLWEALQETYYSSFIDTATDISLDYAVASLGIARLLQTYSKALCQLSGDLSTFIPANTQFQQSFTNVIFFSVQDVVLNNRECVAVKLIVNDTTAQKITISIGGINYSYDIIVNDSILNILTKLKEKIIDDRLLVTIDNEMMTIASKKVTDVFSCFVTENLTITEVTNNCAVKAEKKGYITVPAHSIQDIFNVEILGLAQVDNATAGDAGRDVESDHELRDRVKQSLAISSSGTILAIKAKLLQLEDVTTVSVSEDTTAHTISILVAGGDDDKIATTIFESKPAGIETIGNVSKSVEDIYYSTHTIKFSRPQKIFIFSKIKIYKNVAWKNEYSDSIKNNLVALFKDKKIGDGVLYQSLFSAIYSKDGVATAEIQIASTPVENVKPTIFKSENITLSLSQIAVTDTDKIEIEVV